jgi:hypothetical protein
MSAPARSPSTEDGFDDDLRSIQQQLSLRFDPGDISSTPRLASAAVSGLSGALSWNCNGISTKLEETENIVNELSERASHAAELTDALHEKALELEKSLATSRAAIHGLKTTPVAMVQRIAYSLKWMSSIVGFFFPRETEEPETGQADKSV